MCLRFALLCVWHVCCDACGIVCLCLVSFCVCIYIYIHTMFGESVFACLVHVLCV